jgi:tetratricopeptide (TPR) repeat protein
MVPSAFTQSRQQTDAQTYYDRGTTRGSQGDLDGAIADYDQAIQLEPNYINAYFKRGLLRHSKGDLDGAIADYDQAIRLDPIYSLARLPRGEARYSKGDLDGAMADFDWAIQLYPKYALAYDARGLARKSKGDLDGAIADYDQAIRLDPNFAAAYTGRGLAYEAKKDSVRARADFTAALAAPENSENGKWAHHTARQHLTGIPDWYLYPTRPQEYGTTIVSKSTPGLPLLSPDPMVPQKHSKRFGVDTPTATPPPDTSVQVPLTHPVKTVPFEPDQPMVQPAGAAAQTHEHATTILPKSSDRVPGEKSATATIRP